MHKHDAAAYKVGDPIFIRESRGWAACRASEYRIARITPGGQIIAKRSLPGGEVECRVNSRGDVIGDDRKFVCSPEKAAELAAEERLENAWRAITVAARGVEEAGAAKNKSKLSGALLTLARANEALARLGETQHG